MTGTEPPAVAAHRMNPEPSGRELDVLIGIAEGLPVYAIAKRHSLSEHTVKTHLRRLYKKIGAANAANAVHIGYTTGIFAGMTRPEPIVVTKTITEYVTIGCCDHCRAAMSLAMRDPSTFHVPRQALMNALKGAVRRRLL